MQAAQNLSAKQARFVAEYLVDGNGAAAAVRAGYAPGSAKVAASRMLTKDNPVRRAIQARQDADSVRLGVSRDQVIAQFLAAYEMAKLNSIPSVMVSATVALSKLLGLYMPERLDVAVSAAGQGAMKRLEAMTDAELVELLEAGRAT